jgi:hypothetical protein
MSTRTTVKKRRPGSAKGEILYMAPDAFKPLHELPIGEIVEWLPYLYTDAEIRKLRRASRKLSPRQVLKS